MLARLPAYTSLATEVSAPGTIPTAPVKTGAVFISMENRITDFFYCNISDIGTDNFQWYEVEKIN